MKDKYYLLSFLWNSLLKSHICFQVWLFIWYKVLVKPTLIYTKIKKTITHMCILLLTSNSAYEAGRVLDFQSDRLIFKCWPHHFLALKLSNLFTSWGSHPSRWLLPFPPPSVHTLENSLLRVGLHAQWTMTEVMLCQFHDKVLKFWASILALSLLSFSL